MFTVKAEVIAGCSLQTDPLSKQGVAGIFVVDLSVFRPFLPIPSPPPRQPIAGTLPALERTPAGPLIPPSAGSALPVSFQTDVCPTCS